MRFLVFCAVLMIAAPAIAGGCYVSEDDETWSILVTERGFVWNQGVTSIELDETGTGTGSPRRIAVTQNGEEAYPYLFHKEDLIFDNGVYTPADASRCK